MDELLSECYWNHSQRNEEAYLVISKKVKNPK